MRLSSLTRLVPALALALLASRGSSAVLQPITWGTATNISGDSDVVTTGTLVTAVNFGATGVNATTVNGVTFSAFGVTNGVGQSAGPTFGVRLQESPGLLTSSNGIGVGSGSFNTLSSDYRTLLGSAAGANAPATITVTLSGDGTNPLVAGRQYLLQAWVNVSNTSGSFSINSQTTLSDFRQTPSTVTLDANVGNSAGGLGQWVTGTFTATTSSAQFKLDGVGVWPTINALQLRDLTSVSVAESASAGWLLAPALGAALAWRHRRNRR
jgi:hypothetical protein